MKNRIRITLMLLAFVALLFTSCKKEDTEPLKDAFPELKINYRIKNLMQKESGSYTSAPDLNCYVILNSDTIHARDNEIEYCDDILINKGDLLSISGISNVDTHFVFITIKALNTTMEEYILSYQDASISFLYDKKIK